MDWFFRVLDGFRPTWLAFQENRWVFYHCIGAAVLAAVLRRLGVDPALNMGIVMAAALAVEGFEVLDGIPPCREPGREKEWWFWDTVGDLVAALLIGGIVSHV